MDERLPFVFHSKEWGYLFADSYSMSVTASTQGQQTDTHTAEPLVLKRSAVDGGMHFGK